MKHQISIVGGQITPIFWGIKERNPDKIHILYTKDSRHHVPIIKSLFSEKELFSYQVNPYDFEEIKEKVENIILNFPDDAFELNLTGGTKVMALACQNIFNILSFNTFYIDQGNRIFDFKEHTYKNIESKIKLDTFINLSGHKKYTSSKIVDYTKDEINFSKNISQLSGTNTYKNLIKAVKTKVQNIESCQTFSYSHDNIKLHWNSPNFSFSNGNSTVILSSKKAFDIAFNGSWWELVIADQIKNWNKIYELRLNVELYSKTVNQNVKNEIDIVLNTGRNLIFIECKSGNVTQDDINKIRAVKRLYGGIASRSILVCKYKPRPDIIEKCNDLGIAIFFERNLQYLNNKLENLIMSMEL